MTQQVQNDTEFTFNLFAADLNIIFGALGEAPHRVADPIIQKLQQQIKLQLDAAAQAAHKP